MTRLSSPSRLLVNAAVREKGERERKRERERKGERGRKRERKFMHAEGQRIKPFEQEVLMLWKSPILNCL